MSNIGSNINLTGANIGKLNLGTQTKTMMQNCSNVATGDNITFNIGTEKGTNRQAFVESQVKEGIRVDAEKPEVQSAETVPKKPFADVFLSHHVGTMNKYALRLAGKLRQFGIQSFVSTNMSAGEDYRQAITVNAVKCKVFVPFINEEWARSEECIIEFNCALRSYTTSKTPQIVPIIIGGFQWIDVVEYPDVYNITANTNCAVLQNNDWDTVFRKIIRTIRENHPGLLG